MVNVAATSKFPTSLLATADVGVFGNNEVAELIADATSGTTTLSLNDATGLEVHQWLALRGPNGFEITQIDAVDLAQEQVTVERAKDGTVGVAHVEGQEVKSVIPAIALNQLRVDLIGVETWLGADGGCVTWDRALKLSPTHDTCPIIELDLKTSTTNTQFIRFSVDGTETGAMLYDATNDAVEFQNIRVDIGTGADLLLEDNRLIRLGTDSDAQILYRSADDRIELISDKDFRFEQVDGTEAVTIDTNAAIITNIDVDPRTDSARSLGNSGARYLDIHVDRIALATDAANPAHSEGLLFYDNTEDAVSYYNAESDITLNIGQEEWTRVVNSTGGVISNGEVVYINGNDVGTGLPTIAKAQADAQATSEVLGIATHDIEDGTVGYVTSFGIIRDVNTVAFSNGAVLYLSATTPGALTATAPTQANFTVRVGVVTKSAGAGAGRIFVNPSGTDLARGHFTEESIPFGGSDGFLSESAELRFDTATNTTIHGGTGAPGITLGGVAQNTRIQIQQEAGIGNVGLLNIRHTDVSGLGAHILSARSRGTQAAQTIVQDGDALSLWSAIGFDGTDYESAARISMEVDGVPGANDMPGRIVFLVTPDGSTTLVEAARISQDKSLQLSGDLVPATDAAATPLDVGTPSLRWQDIIGQRHDVYASAGDANPVARLSNAGLEFGSGGAAVTDVKLARTGVSELTISNATVISRSSTTFTGLTLRATADTSLRFAVTIGGEVRFGNGTAAHDLTLARGASNRLDLGASDHLQIPSGDLRFDDATKGMILKDTQGTPHYWRVTIDNTGALVTTDLGTSLPAT